jgi:hypothetical protein
MLHFLMLCHYDLQPTGNSSLLRYSTPVLPVHILCGADLEDEAMARYSYKNKMGSDGHVPKKTLFVFAGVEKHIPSRHIVLNVRTTIQGWDISVTSVLSSHASHAMKRCTHRGLA